MKISAYCQSIFWLLNTEKIKRKIYENATSNMLGAVNARFLANFELALLSVEDQRKISQFNLLSKKENANYLGLWQMKRKVLYGRTKSGVQKSKEREIKMTTRKDIEQVFLERL